MVRSRLTLGCGDYDRTRAILDGRVGIEGCDVSIIDSSLPTLFGRALKDGDIDIVELSMNSFMIAVAGGSCPYVGLPIFPARSFRHSAIYIRKDRGIAKPEDLAGKTIGLAEYSNTASLVVRGLLHDEYGISPEMIHWRVGDIEEPRRAKIGIPALPSAVDIQAVPGRSIATMLDHGDLDAIIAYQPPSCFRLGSHVSRLFPNWRKVEHEYFRSTQLFPIMHVVVVRRSLLDSLPSLAMRILTAFSQAKDAAAAMLAVPIAQKAMLPWLSAEIEATRALMGDDFWPYGIAPNRKVIETLLRYSHEQHLTLRRLGMSELFVDPIGDTLVVE